MNFLDKRTAIKHREVVRNRQEKPIVELEKGEFREMEFHILIPNLRKRKTGIIFEFKRKSPSKSIINDQADVAKIARDYEDAGVNSMLILTDKDFIIEEYQLIAAKIMGVDVILLIAEAFSKEAIKHLSAQAKTVGPQILMELYSEK